MKKLIFLGAFIILFFLSICVYQYLSFHDGKLHIVFYNVGQGDGIMVRTPGRSVVVIDGGPDDSILSCVSSHMPFWRRTIDLIILTHPHADHINGLISLIQRFEVSQFITEPLANKTLGFKALQSEIKSHAVPLRYVAQGETFGIGSIQFSFVGPSKDFLQLTSPNGMIGESGEFGSLLTDISYGSFHTLLTGDSQASELHDALKIFGNHIISLLQVPHHCSRTGLDYQILDQLNPQLSVISVGAHNRYGHPSGLTINLLHSLHQKFLRTDRDGEVEIISDVRGWEVK